MLFKSAIKSAFAAHAPLTRTNLAVGDSIPAGTTLVKEFPNELVERARAPRRQEDHCGRLARGVHADLIRAPGPRLLLEGRRVESKGDRRSSRVLRERHGRDAGLV